MVKHSEISPTSLTVEEALSTVDKVLLQSRLSNIQELVFSQAWEGRTYAEISANTGYDPDYIKEVGSEIWRSLSKALGEKVSKSNFQAILSRRSRSYSVKDAAQPSQSLLDTPAELDSMPDQSAQVAFLPHRQPSFTNSYQDLSEAVDVSTFYGRQPEMTTLHHWIGQDRCRFVAILGMGGVGKTSLSVKLAQSLAEIPEQPAEMTAAQRSDSAPAFSPFERVIWRSLRSAPTLSELLIDLIRFLTKQQEAELPPTLEGQLNRLIECLRSSRCLVVLDQAEALLEGKQAIGRYRQGYENYGEFFRRIGEMPHQSCVVLTSREKPHEVASLEGEALPVRVMQLSGLSPQAAWNILTTKGLIGNAQDYQTLIDLYRGNPLMLKIIATSIRELFDGRIADFLEQGTIAFNGICNLLDQQFDRLSRLETQLMYWLAINPQPVPLAQLQDDLNEATSKAEILEALESLLRRSLIARKSEGFMQQPVVKEYTIERVTRYIYSEILSENSPIIHCPV